MDIENAELRRDNAHMAAKLADQASLVEDLQKQIKFKNKIISDLTEEINTLRGEIESIRALHRP